MAQLVQEFTYSLFEDIPAGSGPYMTHGELCFFLILEKGGEVVFSIFLYLRYIHRTDDRGYRCGRFHCRYRVFCSLSPFVFCKLAGKLAEKF